MTKIRAAIYIIQLFLSDDQMLLYFRATHCPLSECVNSVFRVDIMCMCVLECFFFPRVLLFAKGFRGRFSGPEEGH